MREISFRAWDKNSKVMINDYAKTGQFGELYPASFPSSAYSDKGCPDLILLQFTGLLDETGKKIFEGDIVEDGSIVDDYGKPFRGLIGFERSAFRFIKTNCDCGECLDSVVVHGGELIVVGNVYEMRFKKFRNCTLKYWELCK